jgi:hypothetical protein
MLMTWHTMFSFSKSAADLENDRLRAQIDDCAVLVDMIQSGDGKTGEPTYYMWRYNLDALLVAGMIYSMEWTFHRGYTDKTFWKFSRLADERCSAGHGNGANASGGEFRYEPPPWFRDADVCRSHRSVLVGAEPEAYADQWAKTPKNMPLLWPFVKEPGVYELRVAKADLPDVRRRKLVIPAPTRERVVNL